MHDAIIIGAGMSGICAAIRLRQAGFDDIRILEKSDGFGGTWRDNVYPGCACDVPSHLYSFSFALNPDWSRRYPPQREILDYFERVARDHGLQDILQTGAEVAAARWDADGACWTVTLADGQVMRARTLIAATGQLNRPQAPDFPGRDSFAGPAVHSARWPRDMDLAGKRVGIVGVGPSAIQIIPHAARAAAHLTVFQRTPNYVFDRKDRPFSPRAKWLFRHAPGLMRAYRNAIYWRLEANFAGFGKSAAMARLLTAMCRKKLEREVADPGLREKLWPRYPVGCKRILILDEYLPVFARDNVTLETDGIARVHPDGIETAAGSRHRLDVIIWATGFKTTGFLAPMEIAGVDGASLQARWRDGAEAYLGVTVPGFPNFFMLYGPNTNLGHNSIIFMVERQVEYVVRLLRSMRARAIAAIDLRPDVMDAFNARLQADLAGTAWAADCASWYKTADGRITNNWSTWTVAYWRRTRKAGLEDFNALAPAARPAL